MLRKICPYRPRYFNRPLEDKHGCDNQVSWNSLVSKGITYCKAVEDNNFTLTTHDKLNADFLLRANHCVPQTVGLAKV